MFDKLLDNVRYFFSPEALDARIEPDFEFIAANKRNGHISPPLWDTFEFRFYYVGFAIIVPFMFRTVIHVTNESNENYNKFERYLSKGWLFGRKVDHSDIQYKFLREHFFPMLKIIAVYLAIRRATAFISRSITRLRFDSIFGLIFVFGLHGVNAFKIFFHMIIMYATVHVFQSTRPVATVLTWAYGITSLFLNSKFRSYSFGDFSTLLRPLDSLPTGTIKRWDAFYNFALLRLLSYTFDYLENLDNRRRKVTTTRTAYGLDTHVAKRREKWSRNNRSASKKSHNPHKVVTLNERERLVAPLSIEEYNFFNFTSYILYAPLFIAGPIITYNDYIYQSYHTLPSINIKRISIYMLRFIVIVLTMEVFSHYIYVDAASKVMAWEHNTPFELSMIGLFILNITSFKMTIVWRFFRLWALVDGIDAPENMIRLIDNNYSTQGFWRAWHRSYNKWLIRYVYVPLGGSHRRVVACLAIFTFVAIWHDIQLHLLKWGWLIVLSFLPEMILVKSFTSYKHKWWYRYISALGGVINIWIMMIANLFGYCIGYEGTVGMLHDMFCTMSGFVYFVITTYCLGYTVLIMFELREDEKRRGINLKC
ncbi:hypothetical protein KAFR_0G00140 [Kazachstania africana CBS 2517]|uniref:Uncharacterized protein n=1 Tax=Kazachstania africana (strain ATCC 22294 / BCRC 22015 / CBS 2517 / CECT 1963 / NBRC 1671 / NRRL Y-8276) TaxID=1071382 RepID=H2AXE7_KAZAF|nr:hypothetical protein KAFR_0G00140 [Kazachstania africana CBS 2517]CCF59047.1 hypothetical protein KAFR_0G00140 [Kazachstania africana CBS 2517]